MSETSTTQGILFLIPIPLGDNNPVEVLPETIPKTVGSLLDFIVENEKTARKFIKSICPEVIQSELRLSTLNKRTTSEELKTMLQPCEKGMNIGLMSEAGCPGVADPGAAIVALAHQKGIKVVPMVGPSSILLALMGSGMNGQSFAFNGYLPIEKNEKKLAIRQFENKSLSLSQSQIFIETPYRNNKLLEDFLNFLQPETLLCIAADLTLSTEFIKTKTVKEWKKNKPELHNRPAIFIVQKY
ncbi:MAG: SAM-dependent methyltransferase [Flavobacterium sp.]